MKKLFFLSAMSLLTVVAFAQNNTATVSQTGNENEAVVDQEGADHEATITQSNWGLPAHFAKVEQKGGTNNEAWVLQDQRGATVTIDQIGSDNLAKIKQSGPNDAGVEGSNEAGISQIGDNNEVLNHNFSGNAFQKNGTSFDNDKNWLQVDQIGNENQAGIWQEHHNDATISQVGDGNDASVYQVSVAGGEVNVAGIEQEGNDNSASISQTRTDVMDGLDNWGSILQTGDLNMATMVQEGDSHWSQISQNGNSNIATVTQK